jgi:co-chaperonin GroES (HSP10)
MIKILLHHLLIKLDEATEADEVYRRAKAAGIELALDKREQKAVEYGTVIQVGPTAFIDYGRGPDIVKVGDRVSISRYSGKAVKDVDNTEYVIVNDNDVLCLIEESE